MKIKSRYASQDQKISIQDSFVFTDVIDRSNPINPKFLSILLDGFFLIMRYRYRIQVGIIKPSLLPLPSQAYGTRNNPK